MPRVLCNGSALIWAVELEVGEQYVSHNAPATAAWKSSRFVCTVTCRLQLKTADPGLDISTISDVPISQDDGDVADLHIFDAGIWDGQPTLYQAEHVSSVWRTFEILSEASDGHTVASVTGSISDVDII